MTNTSGPILRTEFDYPDHIEDVFRIVCRGRFPFFLDSGIVMPGLGRWSLLGSDPFLLFTAQGHTVTTRHGDAVTVRREDPFGALRRHLCAHRLPPAGDLPFAGGAVGYLGYDLGRHIERLPRTTLRDIALPDVALGFHDTALVLDHVARRGWIVAAELGIRDRPPPEARAAQWRERLASDPPPPPAIHRRPGELLCNFTREEYLRAVQRAKDYIAAGDIFQVNLSRRFETDLVLPPPELYLELRRVNLAPMAAYLEFDEGAVVSASPERFLKVRDGRVETRPIKGTRPRGAAESEDRALAEELLASEKDNAELAMIVDLERNDLGRVCDYGSVKVTEPRALESYPTVHHLVATVEGELYGDRDLVSLLKATFPGGSITGAPKIRAMEIIDELEPTARSVYTGAIGYLGFDGGMDLSIVIRTLLACRGRLYLQAGGGIVADSELEAEYDETAHKAKALIAAVTGRDEP
jgi:para-aminobenzoate synthetase component 1